MGRADEAGDRAGDVLPDLEQHALLLRLGQVDRAKLLLERCLTAYHAAGDTAGEAKALSALADVWDQLGDSVHAIIYESQALAAKHRHGHPEDRAASHDRLARYLRQSGAVEEAKDHWLAGLVYRLAGGVDPRASRGELGVRIFEATRRLERYDVPRLADLLARSAFTALRVFLAERGVLQDEIQAKVDEIVAFAWDCVIGKRDEI